MIFTVKYNF